MHKICFAKISTRLARLRLEHAVFANNLTYYMPSTCNPEFKQSYNVIRHPECIRRILCVALLKVNSSKARQALQDSSLLLESENFVKIIQVLRSAQNDKLKIELDTFN